MAYTITYKFGTSSGVGEAVAGDHLVRMSMEFTVQDTGTNVEKFARDYGIHIKKYGALEWSRNIDENLMVPGQFNFSLLDMENELWALLFEGSLVPAVEKDGKITLEINYWDGYSYSGYITEFIGNIDVTNIEYNTTNKIVAFDVLPKTDKLKNIYLYNEDTSKSGYYTANNPLSLSTSIVNNFWVVPATNIKTIIHEIFKQINSTCNLSWRHAWKFEGHNLTASPTVYDEFVLEDLKLSSNYLSALFYSLNNIMRYETLYDFLMKLSFTFGFICGMITSEKAFVKNIYSYDAGQTQTLGRVKKHRISNKYGDVEAVRITSRRYRKSKEVGLYEEDGGSLASVIPYGSQVRGENIIDEEIAVRAYDTILTSIYQDFDLNGSYGGNQYEISKALPPGVATYQILDSAVANFYYNLRNRSKVYPNSSLTSVIGRVDDFTVENINYDYMKDFPYAGNGYQILSLKKDITKNESEIGALLVADVMEENTPTEGNGYPRPFTNILPGGYLKNYEYNAEVDADDANSGSATLYSVTNGTLVKRILLLFTQGFNNISSVTITDGSGVLKPSSEISWNQDGAVLEVVLMKTYSSNQDIVINFTKTGTVTTGAIDCIIELSRKD